MGRAISLVSGSVCLVWSSLALAQQDWDTDGNDPPSGHFLGTTAMAAYPDLTFKVYNQRALLIDWTYDGVLGDVPANIIGGHWNNEVANGVFGAVICGGGSYEPYSWYPNVVNDRYGVVVGGGDNWAGNQGNATDAQYAAVVGGFTNTANAAYSFVGGGLGNFANGSYAVIVGGQQNYASGSDATIGGGRGNSTSGSGYGVVAGGWSNAASNLATVSGGYSNDASGYAATVPGGYDNTASGSYSFAAGRRARASYQGCFVWADSTDADMTCSVNNRVLMRASGGFSFYTNAAMPTGVYLAPGSGSWGSYSDVHVKRDFADLDVHEILRQVVSLPITSWRYESEDAAIRHIGPTAQDFYDRFGLGDSERHITVIDADGVALAAIQALNAEVEQLRRDLGLLVAAKRDADRRAAADGVRLSAFPVCVAVLLVGVALAAAAVSRRGRRTGRRIGAA